ncbi:hypothetical protein GCM10027612_72150 [Microbispora bryophytorum subsp. camponoti]
MESVRSVTRAAGIVDVVANGGAEGARLMDVVTATGLQKTTVHRILATLTELGWLEQTEAGSFHLGPKLVGLGTEALNRHGIVDIAGPRLAALARTTHDTVFLSTRSGIESLCVDRVLGSFPIRTLTLQVGDRRPSESAPVRWRCSPGCRTTRSRRSCPAHLPARVIRGRTPRLCCRPRVRHVNAVTR